MPQLRIGKVQNQLGSNRVRVPVTITVDDGDKQRVGAVGFDVLYRGDEVSIERVETAQTDHRAFLFSPRGIAAPEGMTRKRVGVFPDFRTPIPALWVNIPLVLLDVELDERLQDGDRVILNPNRVQIAATDSEVLCGPGALASRPQVCGHLDGLINVAFNDKTRAAFDAAVAQAQDSTVTIDKIMEMIVQLQTQQP